VVDTISSPVESELFITALNVNTGNLIEHISFPFAWANNQSADGLAQVIDNNGDLITLGYFQRALDFNPFDGITNEDTTASYLSSYEYNPYVLKLNWLGFSSIDDNYFVNSLLIYPNPTENQLNIQSKIAIQEISIIDLNGRLVLNQSGNSQNSLKVELSMLKSGIYLLKTLDVNGDFSINKIIKK
jgi:hypothetical protein